MNFCIVIPARYASTRMPAKLVQDINGKPLIQRTYENAINSQATEVIIATDDKRIAIIAEEFGAKVCMTDVSHDSGTSRIAQALSILNIADDTVVVNLQGDEPMLESTVINQVAKNLIASKMDMSTLCAPIESKEQYLNSNCVKVVFDKFGRALYFSRSPIPAFRNTAEFDKKLCFKHVGIYAYRSGFVKNYLKITGSTYENIEKLEQLSALYAGFSIHVELACADVGYGIDTISELELVKQILDKK